MTSTQRRASGLRNPHNSLPWVAVFAALLLAGCGKGDDSRPETADEFVARISAEFEETGAAFNAANFAFETNMSPENEVAAAKAEARFLELGSRASAEARQYAGLPMSPESARVLQLLRLSSDAPAPSDPAKREELATLLARMSSAYATGKHCPAGPESCQNLEQLDGVLANSRDYDAQLAAWAGWHDQARPLRKDFRRFVELGNAGAQELGFADLGELWRSRYDMEPGEFREQTRGLWEQVKPLYQALHCHARSELQEKYGTRRVPDGQPIPAHLFGNMWAQQWNNAIDMLEPYPGIVSQDITGALLEQGYDAARMTRTAESFYTSLGFDPLPQSFWQNSMLERPAGRAVMCHATSSHVDGDMDVRLNLCAEPTEQDFNTLHQMIGHMYFFLGYRDQPWLFRERSLPALTDAVGGTARLSVTDGYLAAAGLGKNDAALGMRGRMVLNRQMRFAVETIAFLPFGQLVDEWRWSVYSGEIPPEKYNQAWWDLRRKYQGMVAPVARSEADFDPGAKYHIPGNVPYTDYFLSFVLQFQFHRALCTAAGHSGPLHECSIAGNKEAGRRLAEMMKLGASRPWQDSLEALTGSREPDASAIIDYFRPLKIWLDTKNAGRDCGW